MQRNFPDMGSNRSYLVTGDAELSEDGIYRYSLSRRWGEGSNKALFIMLNPSTADASKNDATIRRCIRFSQDWGYDQLIVGNLFAYRATDPGDLLAVKDPVGPENDSTLLRLADNADLIIAAWGNNGKLRDRNQQVMALLENRQLYALIITKEGEPGHPLRVRAETKPFPIT